MPDTGDLLEELRPRAFAVAYRMLGSVSEAEDVVQEALIRVDRAVSGGQVLESPLAFVTTVATRLAITELQSARARRETYVGDWLPEPILTDGDPARLAETSDALSLALLVSLEMLTPPQRAAFLLHDVFDYGYDAIAEILDIGPDAARQHASRARKHVADRRPRFSAGRDQHRELVRRFQAAAENGDLAGLEALLAADVTMTGDGGGKVPALGRTVHGSARVAKTLANGTRAFGRLRGVTWREAQVNGGPGLVYTDGDGALIGVLALEVSEGRIVSVDAVVNPDKLQHLGPVGDAVALLEEAHPRA